MKSRLSRRQVRIVRRLVEQEARAPSEPARDGYILARMIVGRELRSYPEALLLFQKLKRRRPARVEVAPPPKVWSIKPFAGEWKVDGRSREEWVASVRGYLWWRLEGWRWENKVSLRNDPKRQEFLSCWWLLKEAQEAADGHERSGAGSYHAGGQMPADAA